MSEFLSRLGGAAMNDLRGTPLDKILNHLMGGQQGASGLEALVAKLRGGGLGEQVDSWVGTGANREVTPEQLELALGEPEATRMAQEAGVPREGLMGVLASLLPGLVDRATPAGQLPRDDREMPQGGIAGILGSLLGGGGATGGTGPNAGAGASAGGLGGLLGSLQGGPMGAGPGGGLGGVLGSLLGGGVGKR